MTLLLSSSNLLSQLTNSKHHFPSIRMKSLNAFCPPTRSRSWSCLCTLACSSSAETDTWSPTWDRNHQHLQRTGWLIFFIKLVFNHVKDQLRSRPLSEVWPIQEGWQHASQWARQRQSEGVNIKVKTLKCVYCLAFMAVMLALASSSQWSLRRWL